MDALDFTGGNLLRNHSCQLIEMTKGLKAKTISPEAAFLLKEIHK